uniref:Integrase, catalytic region, zinc finger, CCHC-type, peptidase aspartic, catalytic n=1 Tax=Tanacetum cinerariifolium TaxID=118510 RepID=A0A6L2N7P2_TANCI|nr:integrase, catalytic region, zinc finger, CCHC-type, peptidase aspartic, catalytic [Tanacetum cinerariifolium]
MMTLADKAILSGADNRPPMLEKDITAKVSLIANLSYYGSDALAENSMNSSHPNPSKRPTKVEVPKELSKVSMVDTSLKKLKHHLADFDMVVKTYKQLYDLIKPICVRSKEQSDALINQVNLKSVEISDLNANLQEQGLITEALRDELRKLKGKDIVDNVLTTHTIDPEMLKVDVKPIAPRLLNNRTVHSDYLRLTQEQATILREVIQIVFSYLDSGCSKHMTGDRSQLTNFDNKFLGTVKFGNDHVEKIIGGISHETSVARSLQQNGVVERRNEKLYLLYMDLCGLMRVASVNGKKYILVIVDDYSRFIWVKCLRSKDEASDFIIKFLKMIQVRLKTTVYRIRTYNGTEFVNQTLREYYEKVDISHETSVARSSQQNGVVERRNHTLIEAAPTISLEPTLHEMTPATISLRLVQNPPPSTSFVPPSRSDWDLLFQLLFDELLTPSPSVDHSALEVIAPIAEVVAPKPVVLTGLPSLTIVNQDAPSPSNSQTTPKTQSPVISNDVKEENHDLDVAHMNNDPFFCDVESPKTPTFYDDPLHESLHEDSTSQGSSSNMRQTHTSFKSLTR